MLMGLFLALACQVRAPQEKVYPVRYLPQPRIGVDGVADEPAWQQAAVERGFAFPWTKQAAPATEFRAVCDDQSLYFTFRVHDDDLVLVEDFREKLDVVREDRVELFFAPDEKLTEYYCLEMDPRGRTLDYRASYHRKFDYAWSFPGVRVAGKPIPVGVPPLGGIERGYVVEGAIRLARLESLGLPLLRSGKKIKFGIFRAEFSHGQEGRVIEDWISWVDPQTKAPDFHVPSAFGYLQMVK